MGQRATRGSAQEQHWSVPNNDIWPIMKVLTTQDCIAPDRMLKLPSKNHTYIDSQGKLKDPYKYAWGRELASDPEKPLKPLKIHPTLARHIKRGTATKYNRLWYENMDDKSWAPLAGVIAPRSRRNPKVSRKNQLPGTSVDALVKTRPSVEATTMPVVTDLVEESNLSASLSTQTRRSDRVSKRPSC